MKQELENKRPDSEERRSIWQRWKQNLKDWAWFCKEHPDWLDLDVQTWVSTHIGQPLRRRWRRLPAWAPTSGSGSPAAAREPSAPADGCGPSSRA